MCWPPVGSCKQLLFVFHLAFDFVHSPLPFLWGGGICSTNSFKETRSCCEIDPGVCSAIPEASLKADSVLTHFHFSHIWPWTSSSFCCQFCWEKVLLKVFWLNGGTFQDRLLDNVLQVHTHLDSGWFTVNLHWGGASLSKISGETNSLGAEALNPLPSEATGSGTTGPSSSAAASGRGTGSTATAAAGGAGGAAPEEAACGFSEAGASGSSIWTSDNLCFLPLPFPLPFPLFLPLPLPLEAFNSSTMLESLCLALLCLIFCFSILISWSPSSKCSKMSSMPLKSDSSSDPSPCFSVGAFRSDLSRAMVWAAGSWMKMLMILEYRSPGQSSGYQSDKKTGAPLPWAKVLTNQSLLK